MTDEIMKTKLPEGWREVELENLLLISKSGCWGDEASENDGTPVIRSTNFTKDLKLKKDKIAYRKISKKDATNKKLEYGDLLLEKSGGGPGQPVGRVIIFNIKMDRDYVCGNFIQILRPDNGKVLFNYLYYYLNLLYMAGFTENLFNKTTGIQNLRLKDYLKIKIPLPTLPTQQKIVSTLEKAEKAKEWRKEANELTNNYLKGVFLEMFGDPVSNSKKFPILKLKDLALIERNSVTADNIRKGDKYVGLEHLESESGRIIKIISVSDGELKSNKFSFDEDCILYGKLRPYLNKIALPNFKGVCSTDIVPIRPIKDKSNKYFISYLLKQPYYVQLATDRSVGANLPRLSPRELELFEIINPPLPLQQKFSSIVKEVEAMKEQQKHSKEQIDNLFSALMQKAFKGELVV